MKLPRIQKNIEGMLSEFDLWVTPSLGDIRDTDQFNDVIIKLRDGMEILSAITDSFYNVDDCSAHRISEKLVERISGMALLDATTLLNNAISVLFLVTGKTDNNIKCQFPLYLSQQIGINRYPYIKNNLLAYKAVPRVLTAESIVKTLASLTRYPNEQQSLTEIYLKLILSDKEYSKQLWSIGHSYTMLKQIGAEISLITSLAIFMSRGSITATTGHDPEEILRARMVEWGLIANEDFNTQDISVASLLGDINADANIKKRKYDFIIPFTSREEGAKLFIQCQYYAGDSGSVSHKNVDQTSSTRAATKLKYPKAVFIEYLDGAGYYSSLNGDLKRILFLPDTKDFFQIRTAPIKLRRELQEIEFLTLMEVEHAILISGSDRITITQYLCEQGYSIAEIDRCINRSISAGLLLINENKLSIIENRKPVVRRYCILDSIILFGHPIPADQITGNIFVPGLNIYWGLPQNELFKAVLLNVPFLKEEWGNIEEAFNDLQWLIDNKYVITK